MIRHYILIALLSAIYCDDNYVQWTSTRLNLFQNTPLPYMQGWETLNFTKISQITSVIGDCIWIIASEKLNPGKFDYQIYNFDNNAVVQIQNTDKVEENSKIIYQQKSSFSTNVLVLVQPSSVRVLNCDQLFCSLYSDKAYSFGKINKLYKSSNNLLFTHIYTATETGLFCIKYDSKSHQVDIEPFLKSNEEIYDIAYSSKKQILAVVTNLTLTLHFELFNYTRWEYTKSVIDNATSVTFRESDDNLFVTSDESYNILQFYIPQGEVKPFYKVYRAGYQQGQPAQMMMQSASLQDWVCGGGNLGVACVNGNLDQFLTSNYQYKKNWMGVGQTGSVNSPWRLFMGQRWVTAGNITSMYARKKQFYIATEYGLTILKYENYNLSRKAEKFQQDIQTHNRFGYFSDVSLKIPGNRSSYQTRADESDAIWTNMYLAGQSLRYNVTNEIEAKQQAWVAFEALERLYKVTPIDGFMARTVIPLQDQKGWVNSTQPGYQNWTYLNGTSSDDVISFYFGLPLFIDHVCESDEERKRPLQMLINTTDYIIENNWYLLDLNGKPTKWGFWGPDQLNENPEQYSERGGNSAEILGMLSICYHYTKDQKYLIYIKDLGIDNQYFLNVLNMKTTYPFEVNFSDDELQYFALFAYLYHQESLPTQYQKSFKQSLQRQFYHVKQYKPSLWIYITYYLYPEIVTKEDLEIAQRDLEQFPMEFITYSVDNTKRLDVMITKEAARNFNTDPRSVDVLRRDERCDSPKWNQDPYLLVSQSDGGNELSQNAFLLPYYMKLYFDNIQKDLEIFK